MNVPLYAEILTHVRSHIYPDRVPLPRWKMKEGDVPHAHSPRLNDSMWKDFTVTTPWGGYDKTVWFRTGITLPKRFAGKPVVVVLDLPEGLLYVNGTPYQGVDQHHREVLLTKRARGGERFQLAIQAYSGRKKRLSCFNSAFVSVLEPDARAFVHAFIALQELEVVLGIGSEEAGKLREIVRRTLDVFNAVSPEHKQFPGTIRKAYEFLLKTLQADFPTDSPGIVHLISQSHIDVVWLWTLKETIRKCGRTFSTALRQMEEFPEFHFTQSQAALYELTKQHYPEIYSHIKKRVRTGRWHPVGAMWVEPDCNIPNGESLVRQILYGKQFFKKEFGIDSTVLWLPDTFGYSWAIPQILKKAGIDYFFTTKLTWNDTNPFPHNTFWWQGIDGTRVLAHLPAVGLEGQVTPMHLEKSWNAFQQKEQTTHTTQTFGYGDGGGGPTKQHVESARALSNVAGLPSSRPSTIQGFFEAVEKDATRLPVWNDELYLELHRGTYTTHGWVKRENRRAETLLYNTELLCTLAMLHNGTQYIYPQQELERAWKTLLLNQFHDIIPGSAIADVYEDVGRDFGEIRSHCSKLQHDALNVFIDTRQPKRRSHSFVIFNALQWTRSDYVEVTVSSQAKAFAVTDGQGNTLRHQIIARTARATRLLCYIENIPPFAFAQMTVSPAAVRKQDELWTVTNELAETPFFTVRLGSDGTLISIVDRALNREIVAEGRTANMFQTFKDMPRKWEAWEIDPEYEKKEFMLFTFAGASVVESGPLRATMRLVFKAQSGSTITQDILMYHALGRIDFRTHVLWHEKQTMLKVAFPLAVRADRATYEVQFGALSRQTKPTSSRDRAKYEVPAQQWADLSEQAFGVSILNDCKYGYDTKDSTLRLTLIRSPHYPHPIEAWWLHGEEFTDQGHHEFTYCLYPHKNDWREGETTRRSRELNNGLTLFAGTLKATPPRLLSVSAPNIVVGSVKKAEKGKGIIVRAYEAHGIETDATFEFGFEPKAVHETDLLEHAVKQCPVSPSIIRFSPFEIKTILITPP